MGEIRGKATDLCAKCENFTAPYLIHRGLHKRRTQIVQLKPRIAKKLCNLYNLRTRIVQLYNLRTRIIQQHYQRTLCVHLRPYFRITADCMQIAVADCTT